MNDLLSAESLSAARFPANPGSQQRFLQEVTEGRTARMELPHNRALAFGAAWAFSLASAALLLAREDFTGVWAAGGSALLHAMAAGFSTWSRRQHSLPDAEPHPSACYRDEHKQLRLRLQEGEEVLHDAPADGRVRRSARVIAGILQMCWGVVLGGVPIALAAGAELSKPGLVLVTVGTFLGTYVFGRGVVSLVGTKPVERVVLTNQRVAVLAAPGVAHSLPLKTLRHRPVVVGRGDGRATVALASKTLPSTHPLPMPGLYGLHDVTEAEAKAWAGDAMDARKALVGSD